jgi:hypothetical protein
MKQAALRTACLIGATLALAAVVVFAGAQPGARKIDFDRDVRRILSENCFACHGFDPNTRAAGLRLDTREGAFSKRPNGNRTIVPGKPMESELFRQVISRAMPPANFNKKLTSAQIETLRLWIIQGAEYRPHWAFVPPVAPVVPDARKLAKAMDPDGKAGLAAWTRNPIDAFLLARLQREGLRPSPEADKRTLIRRVTLDLTGLPPTPEEVAAFLADTRPDAYERVVDRLLASVHYGERMAVKWLDVARYADTHGYHIDSGRDMWRWRDWVIEAFNANMPYDQFTIEQIAGDLLPNAKLSQKIATGFNRNHPINFEGGAIPEEYQTAYVFDRVDTTSTAFLGLTMKCAECHDHKYDPLSMRDFYRLYAFFNNIPEEGLDGQRGNAKPYIKAPLPGQMEELEALDKRIASAKSAMEDRARAAAPEIAAWARSESAATAGAAPIAGLAAHYPLDEKEGDSVAEAAGGLPAGKVAGKPEWQPGQLGNALTLDGSSHVNLGDVLTLERNEKFSYGAWILRRGGGGQTVISRMDDAADFRGWDLYLGDGRVFVHLIHKWEGNAIRVNTRTAVPENRWTHVFATYDGSSKAEGVRIYIDGKPQELEITHNSLSGSIASEKPARIGARTPGAVFRGQIDDVRVYRRELTAEEVGRLVQFEAIRQILAKAEDARTAEEREKLAAYYLAHQDVEYKRLNAEAAELTAKRNALDAAIPTTMVMEEMPKPRETFILVRGQYDKKGEKVTPGTPEALPPMDPEWPANRLGLARWLVSPRNPLTARVAVNRFWALFFGQGLVKTPENFGFQGELPSHSDLLDWLAAEFQRRAQPSETPLGNWDVKRLIRLFVTSAAYKQTSRVTPQLRQHDPENVLLARGPRFRLQAEFVRDQALALAGLLVPKVGGKSVKPYHPQGLWEEIAFGGDFSEQKYVQGTGEDLYRRGMYTFWKRTCPPPSLQTFDAPEREFCVVKRSVTNTPLQALVTLNDPTYVEASRKFAERILREGGPTERDRLRFAFVAATARLPRVVERDELLSLLDRQLARYRKDPEAARKLLSVGESAVDERLDKSEIAAWSAVANVILNLDEVLTRG